LTLGGGQRDDQITQRGGNPVEGVRGSRLSISEGQHVRRAILVPELVVETPHAPITDEGDVHLCSGFTNELEDGLCQFQKPPLIDGKRADMDLEGNGH
jgi:hypothetical protein